MKFGRTNITDMLDDIAAGLLELPPGRRFDELKHDDMELRSDMESYYADYISVIEGKHDRVSSALYKWIANCSRDECMNRFLDEVERFPTPADFWYSFHSCWKFFKDIHSPRLVSVLRRHRPYWSDEHFDVMEMCGYSDLPEFMTVYRSQKKRDRCGLMWTGDFERARFDAETRGNIIIEARIAKRDIASMYGIWLKSDFILFSAMSAKGRQQIEIRRTPYK